MLIYQDIPSNLIVLNSYLKSGLATWLLLYIIPLCSAAENILSCFVFQSGESNLKIFNYANEQPELNYLIEFLYLLHSSRTNILFITVRVRWDHRSVVSVIPVYKWCYHIHSWRNYFPIFKLYKGFRDKYRTEYSHTIIYL